MSEQTQAEKARKRRQKLAGFRPKEETAIRSHEQVAEIMTRNGYPMSRSRVQQLEQQAFLKLATMLAGKLNKGETK